MNKDLVAGVVAITGILLAIGVLVLGDRSVDETETVEPEVLEAAVAENRNFPEVYYNPVDGSVIEKRQGPQPTAPLSSDANAGPRNPPPVDYPGLDESAKEAIDEMLKTESPGFGKRI